MDLENYTFLFKFILHSWPLSGLLSQGKFNREYFFQVDDTELFP